MKACDKYPPATPDDVARIEANCHQGKMHPLYWVVLVVLVIIGVGVYSDVVGFYEFEDIVEIEDDDEDKNKDEDEEDKPENLDEGNWGSALSKEEREIERKSKREDKKIDKEDMDRVKTPAAAKPAPVPPVPQAVQPKPEPQAEDTVPMDGEVEVIEEEVFEELILEDQITE